MWHPERATRIRPTATARRLARRARRLMRAVILAAGEGTRLRRSPLDRPKCLVELAGRPLLAWQIDALRARGVDDVTVVTGYRADQITRRDRRRVHNPRYDDTNMVASLMCARDAFDGGRRRADRLRRHRVRAAPRRRLCCGIRAAGRGRSSTVDGSGSGSCGWTTRSPTPRRCGSTTTVGSWSSAARRRVTPISRVSTWAWSAYGPTSRRRGRARYDALDPHGPYEGRDRDHMFMTAFLQLMIDDGVPVDAVMVDRRLARGRHLRRSRGVHDLADRDALDVRAPGGAATVKLFSKSAKVPNGRKAFEQLPLCRPRRSPSTPRTAGSGRISRRSSTRSPSEHGRTVCYLTSSDDDPVLSVEPPPGVQPFLIGDGVGRAFLFQTMEAGVAGGHGSRSSGSRCCPDHAAPRTWHAVRLRVPLDGEHAHDLRARRFRSLRHRALRRAVHGAPRSASTGGARRAGGQGAGRARLRTPRRDPRRGNADGIAARPATTRRRC